MGALALTAQPAKQDPFRPLPGDVDAVPYGDVDALRAAVRDDTAAIVLEPIQGEGGVVVPPDGYLEAARAIADAHGALLILDEVQTGIGRTGRWFAHQAEGVVPDVMTLAKGLGGGLPIGACVATGRAADLFGPGSHGSDLRGQSGVAARRPSRCSTPSRPTACSREPGHSTTCWRARLVGRSHGLVPGCAAVACCWPRSSRHAFSADVERAARANGLIVNAVAPDAVRLAPALTDHRRRYRRMPSTGGSAPVRTSGLLAGAPA